MNIEGFENISDIFSIFHDGGISSAKLVDGVLNLEVEIQYLAERINPEFKVFNISLHGFHDVEFLTWPSDLKSEPEKITDIEIIFAPELEILESKLNDQRIEVVCNQHSTEYDYCGGELSFYAVSADVQDEAGKYYTLAELDILCKSYSDEWASKNK